MNTEQVPVIIIAENYTHDGVRVDKCALVWVAPDRAQQLIAAGVALKSAAGAETPSAATPSQPISRAGKGRPAAEQSATAATVGGN